MTEVLARNRASGRGTARRLRVQLLYFTPSDLLVPRVDRQCIMRFLDALVRHGVDAEAVSLDVRLEFDEPTRTRDLFDVYGIPTRFPVRILPTLTRQSSNPNPLWRALVFSAWASWRLLLRRGGAGHDVTVLYFKNYLLALPLLLLRRLAPGNVVLMFEIHVPPGHALARRVVRHLDVLQPVSRILARELREDFGIDESRILVAHMGVDLDAIAAGAADRNKARRLLGLPLDRKLVVYTGKVYRGYREIEYLLEAAKLLPEAEMLIVGGRDDQVAPLRAQAAAEGLTNVRFEGFVAPADVFAYQAAADVLVTYYPSDIPLNKYRASPGKLFEYMASGRPIVTADYPALREALSPGAAVFVEKDKPASLAEGVRRVLADPQLGERLARRAYEDVQEFTWEKRAAKVVEFLERMEAR